MSENKEKDRDFDWLLDEDSEEEGGENYEPFYGDLTKLNTNRLLLDNIDGEVFDNLVSDFLYLLGTSAAIYESNGDYAYGIFSSGWCRLLDQASRKLCRTDDNKEALQSGKWICHESCWETAKQAMELEKPVDKECEGGIRLYAIPIRANNKVIGCIDFGYGDPPKDKQSLENIATKYNVDVNELIKAKNMYRSRPPFLVKMAKRRIKSSADMIGKIIELEMTKNNLDLYRNIFTHDISNILQNISLSLSMFSNLDISKPLEDKMNENIKFVKNQIDRGIKLINNSRKLTQITQSELKLEPVNLNKMLGDAISFIHQSYPDKNISIQVNTHSETDEIILDANELLLDVFENLLINSVKYNNKDIIKIEVEISKKSSDQYDIVKMQFKDNGIGIPDERKVTLFSNPRKKNKTKNGMGVGLILSKKIIERFGGEIHVKNRVKDDYTKGSNFVISFFQNIESRNDI